MLSHTQSVNQSLSFIDLFQLDIVSVNLTSLVTSWDGIQEEESQTAYPMCFTWASLISASVLMARKIPQNIQSVILF